jgi:hypothetical protein
MRALIAALVVTVATPAFADSLWDACHKLAQDRVGPIQQSHRRHYEQFVVQLSRRQNPPAPGIDPAQDPRPDVHRRWS